MSKTDFAPWPSFTQEEADAVQRVLLSNKVNYWTGQEGREFEKEFAAFAGTSHAIAVANGTLALDLILAGMEIGAHYGGDATDEIIVTPRSFMASVSTVANAGAKPIFVDVDRDSGNMSAATIAPMITRSTKAIIAVHLAGWPCDMDEIMALADVHGIKVIEDCAQAHGGTYKGEPLGGIGHAAAWSFCQDKIMTTGGEGGMVTTNDAALWDRMWSFKDHGKSFDTVFNKKHAPGFRWLHESFGTNWRLTEMQSAIGRIQLKRMPEWTEKRTANAQALINVLGQYDSIRMPLTSPENQNAFYKLYSYVEPDRLSEGWSRDRIVAEINAKGIPCMQGSCSEIYLEKAFDGTGWRPKQSLPVAEELGEKSLMFLVHPTLSRANIEDAVTAFRDILNTATA
ncbi:DegT/DnrJ/EryC1/StrS aminotransferase family protein [Sulfitobacter sp. CB2047]|uniref:DegT/DnrJ/EryC1/StrS family aminotransferase n=1 Tax=Sulfitobacter sp. CB2047 TaxID=1525218 RepID=UPI0004E2DEF5|nr:DegT/DnrJ/EryC1/StrS aminotransferase family protein [Sulfitobacter sp. CB2047]ULO22247.1 DegT/DnrJ/EryC1/StrS aminotransferase family protein [Sulfitobacter sp. CB2047]